MPTGVYERKKRWQWKTTKNHKGSTGKHWHVSGRIHSEETREKMSVAHKGHEVSEETRKKIGVANSIALKGRKYKKDGEYLTPKNKRAREVPEMRLWRKAVYQRDEFTCQRCKERGIYLIAHHIKNFAEYIELRSSVDNGITFCRNCHDEFHKIYKKSENNKMQVLAFIRNSIR